MPPRTGTEALDLASTLSVVRRHDSHTPVAVVAAALTSVELLTRRGVQRLDGFVGVAEHLGISVQLARNVNDR